jgi:hypothetical protein
MSTWPNRGAPAAPCGGLEQRKTKQPRQSGRDGLTQANRPPRKPVRFTQQTSVNRGHQASVNPDVERASAS